MYPHRLPRRRTPVAGLVDERALVDGMDCSVEVKVEYPPTSTRRFIRSAAKVHIASTRNAGERGIPTRHTMRLQTLPFQYPKLRPDELNRGIANGVLCIILLSASIAASLRQLTHLKSHADVARRTSPSSCSACKPSGSACRWSPLSCRGSLMQIG
ncbi:hypothetical protein SEVIR_2G379000v4 [Setaria viridis]|uniref:DUF2921 domain-containing protein n=1 Tax=Setaria viridis TaxID=4556 RepID=A0A4U6WCK1_SETVI|nr:hypothetical protein SEVIR_2G379000v2 [Setaria viridis]